MPLLKPDLMFEYLHHREFSAPGTKFCFTKEEEERLLKTALAETNGGRGLSFVLLKKLLTREVRKMQAEQPEKSARLLKVNQSGKCEVSGNIVQSFIKRNSLQQFTGRGKKIGCDVCGRSFFTKTRFLRHMSTKHSQMLYSSTVTL